MSLSKNLYKELSLVTSNAAIAAFHFIGKNDKNAADKAAVDVMRKMLNDMIINGIEIGGGSIRIHKRAVQAKMIDVMGLTKEEAEAQFSFL